MASANSNRMSRDDFKKAKELEELRKSGALEPEKDEDGKDINPHIPQYISQAPWYLDASSKPGLKHQKAIKVVDYTKEWYHRGAKVGKAAEKFRKGACENCGAMTHKKKDCVERPRKLGAVHTGKDIQPDELIEGGFVLSYEGRRDRWNGYDNNTYTRVIEQFDQLEDERKKVREKKTEEAVAQGIVPPSENFDEDDEAVGELKDTEGKMVGQKFNMKTRCSVRNLRIREDTAKYLRNLDVNSAFYDPKTRSMRLNPNPEIDPEQADFAGENFVRYSGETRDLASLQLYEFGANEKGEEVHLQAAPTQAQYAHNQFKEKKEMLTSSKQQQLLQKYGGAEHIQASLPAELKYGQTEAYLEYNRDGSLIKGHEETVPRSKYQEDVFPQNHTSVWGSWWHDGDWGFACCHSKVRNSFCTGEEGKAAARMVATEMERTVASAAEEKKQKDKKKPKSEEEKKAKALKKALQEEDERARLSKSQLDERKRAYNSLSSDHTVTEEEMEAYRMKRSRGDDPMANFV